MPLTKPDNVLPGNFLTCGCGSKFSNYGAYYAHVGDCPILRCYACLAWLDGEHETTENHVCAAVRLMQVDRTMLEKFQKMREILDHG